jgi:hypothetical protein
MRQRSHDTLLLLLPGHRHFAAHLLCLGRLPDTVTSFSKAVRHLLPQHFAVTDAMNMAPQAATWHAHEMLGADGCAPWFGGVFALMDG